LFFSGSIWNDFYASVANGFLWPLLHFVRHDLTAVTGYYPAPGLLRASEWTAFRAVNRAFAAAGAEIAGVRHAWIHDYQLGLVPRYLRESGFEAPIGFFLHTPFPNGRIVAPVLSTEGARRFREWCEGVLGADLVGFQTNEDAERFRDVVAPFGAVRDGEHLSWNGRRVRIGVHPVGIDEAPVRAALESVVADPLAIHRDRIGELPIVVGLERADYTKGIPERHRAIARAFMGGQRFAYFGVSAPTRRGVAGYSSLSRQVEEATEEASAAAKVAGVLFEYRLEAIGWAEVVGLLAAADVVFTSSLADGMNLVPLQAVLAQSGKPVQLRGTILAGRDAGVSSTYSQFSGAGLTAIEPTDIPGSAVALSHAISGRAGRISDEFVAEARALSAHHWAERFMAELEETQC
jgi:trehalose 6-phosphate synthase